MLLQNRQHDIFRASAYTEFSTPNAHARADVILCRALPQRAEGILINGIRDPRCWQHLPMMGMSAKLKVYAILLSFLQVVRLMVEKNGKISVYVNATHYISTTGGDASLCGRHAQ